MTGIKVYRHGGIDIGFTISFTYQFVPMFQSKKVYIGFFRIPKVKSLDFAVQQKKSVSISLLKQCGTLEQTKNIHHSIYIYNINISSSSKGLKKFAPKVIHKVIHRFCVALHMEHDGTWNRLWNKTKSYKFNQINDIAPTRLVVR